MKLSKLRILGGSPQSGETATAARRYWISGWVQGVGYRMFAEREARRLGLVGYVKNLADGRVEAYAAGDALSLAEFKKRLVTGPSGARVTKVKEISEPAVEPYTSFDITC